MYYKCRGCWLLPYRWHLETQHCWCRCYLVLQRWCRCTNLSWRWWWFTNLPITWPNSTPVQSWHTPNSFNFPANVTFILLSNSFFALSPAIRFDARSSSSNCVVAVEHGAQSEHNQRERLCNRMPIIREAIPDHRSIIKGFDNMWPYGLGLWRRKTIIAWRGRLPILWYAPKPTWDFNVLFRFYHVASSGNFGL